MRFKPLFLTSLFGIALFAACGSDGEDRPAMTGEPGTPDSGTTKRDTGTGNNVDPGFNPTTDSGVVGGEQLPGQCAADTQQAQQLPLDLYLMVDTSGSMDGETAAGTTKWTDLKSALTAFVDDPNSAGLGVGLEFFPAVDNAIVDACSNDGECGAKGPCWQRRACVPVVNQSVQFCAVDGDCPGATSGSCQDLGVCIGLIGSGGLCLDDNNCSVLATCSKPIKGYCKGRDSCTVADYASPASPIAALPGAAGGIKSLLGARKVDGLTPTGPALGGAIDAAKAQRVVEPNHTVAVVLATDGFPTECTPTDIPSIANLAQSGNTAGVKTFVIGVFAPEEEQEAKANLNQIASKGGSGQAFVITTGQNVSQAFLQALNTIRGAALPCEYKLPVPTSGKPDYNKVNVQYTDGAGQKTTIFYVGGQSSCDPTSGGWYYDTNPASGTPTKVIICPKTCEGFKADGKAKVDIVQGCETVTPVK